MHDRHVLHPVIVGKPVHEVPDSGTVHEEDLLHAVVRQVIHYVISEFHAYLRQNKH